MTPFSNRSISASAGTGKTYRLTHRYLGLMAAGIDPDRICALTFSRKAAGEIFDKTVEHLCAAATDGAKRAATAATIRMEGLKPPPDQPDAYVCLLRKLLDHGHRLRIGTLDSFILGVVRAFPMELGIPPDTRPMDGEGGEALAARHAILARLFDPSYRTDTDGSRALLTELRQARFGLETKALLAVLDSLIRDYYGFYRQHGSKNWQWGDPKRVWKPAERWWEDAGAHAALPEDLKAQLMTAFGEGKQQEKLAESCADIAAAALGHAADKPWPKMSEKVLSQLLLCAAQNASPIIAYYKKEYAVPDSVWPALRSALCNLIAVEVRRSTEQTQGLRNVLDRYDALYAAAQSTEGRFTFDDLTSLLGAEGRPPSRTPAAPDRLYIDYRLDGKLDHWLLDEFQDTSDAQWGALANLVDEVVQDPNQSRSFFYVGDVKQSIYGWRGGNYRLFSKILAQYRALGQRAIQAESINECHRSLPAIIETVNQVFDGLSTWVPGQGEEKGPRREAIDAFTRFWKKHESARRGEGAGFASLLEYTPQKASTGAEAGDDADDEGADDPAEFEAVAKILEHVRPTRNGLTTAVLVRSNSAGRACVDALRRRLPDMPCVHEGKGGITDSPVVTLLLALVRYAAHPGDTAALRHLQMSPLAGHPEISDHTALPEAILTALNARGFADTLREWGNRLAGLDAFSRQRLREMLAAAEQFDARGVCDPDAFADHIEAYQVKSNAAAGTIRVMTVHQAKGLGFDLVIVPFAANAKSFGSPGDPTLLADENWILEPPCNQALEAADGAPLRALEAARADANFAQLCVLYVALTRAQQALYMVIPQKGKTSKTIREADLLQARLAAGTDPSESAVGLTQLFAVGDAEWFTHPVKCGAGTQAVAPAPVNVAYAAGIVRREPSKEHAEGRELPAHWLFKAESGDVRAFGSAIHRFFQKIEWVEDADIERIVAEWRLESAETPALLADVERQFRNCLANDAVRQWLAKPTRAAHAEVWREAPFELALNVEGEKQLMSGRFDRLVVERDVSGHPVRATIIDFKSNRITSEKELQEAADGYSAQMTYYATAAARLLAISAAQITTVLLFTRSGKTWPR
ncbi:MAG TPA: UvrD-helicase domain-containing protein [Kiritimatiellia bacterium]|nr:UvrD-helicase domain-containing protein [Kiritimatiellia bacterium]HPS08011.1 UvrD-helicase domain-containing protein [Kiritimatiellia bacterium]